MKLTAQYVDGSTGTYDLTPAVAILYARRWHEAIDKLLPRDGRTFTVDTLPHDHPEKIAYVVWLCAKCAGATSAEFDDWLLTFAGAGGAEPDPLARSNNGHAALPPLPASRSVS